MTATTTMERVRTVVVGGGPAGLATSHGLVAAGIDHVVLERARIAERWRSERWDSLRLLTPNWMTRLPGLTPTWTDPHGYLTAPEVVDVLTGYASSFDAPVREQTPVEHALHDGTTFRITTPRTTWLAEQLVVATGATGEPTVPGAARALDPRIHQLHSRDYKRPGQLPAGGVLVVGAAASGVQVADELARAGRDVTLAVGPHTRLPRVWRGLDVQWWLQACGVLGRRAADVSDLDRSMHAPSLQLVGRPDHADLDLGVLRRHDVRLVGQVARAAGTMVWFADDLGHHLAAAEHTLDRLLQRFDAHAAARGLALPAGRRPAPVRPGVPPSRLDLEREGITTVLWATGYRPANPWLRLDVQADDGRVRHDRGATTVRGLHVLGLPFTRRRDSTYLAGIGLDATLLVGELLDDLRTRHQRRFAGTS